MLGYIDDQQLHNLVLPYDTWSSRVSTDIFISLLNSVMRWKLVLQIGLQVK